MKNIITTLPITRLLDLGEAACTGAAAIGKGVGLVLNKPGLIDEDYKAADEAVSAYQKAVAGRVPLAKALAEALGDARTWCFRAKETLAPYLGERHSGVYRPTGFVSSLRVPSNYSGLLSLVGKLGAYFGAHPEQANDKPKVNVTQARAEGLHAGLKKAQGDLDAHEDSIQDAHQAQADALADLRERLQGVCGELKQLIGGKDHRWHRFGFNVPAEPQTPPRPENVKVNSTVPGQVLVSCASVPYADRYRFFIQKIGSSEEPEAVGASSEPLFLIEHLDAGGRHTVFVSAVNHAGNEGPRSKGVVADEMAKAA